MTWIFNTALGRFLLTAAIVLLCWWGFSTYYRAEGKRECQAAAARSHIKAESTGRDIAGQAADETAAIEQAAGETAVRTVETIRTVYRDRVVTQPVAAGSCVHPVDPAVQAELQARWVEANGGAR